MNSHYLSEIMRWMKRGEDDAYHAGWHAGRESAAQALGGDAEAQRRIRALVPPQPTPSPHREEPAVKPYRGFIRSWGIVWHDPHGYVVVGLTAADSFVRTSPIVSLKRRDVVAAIAGDGFELETENSIYHIYGPADADARAAYEARMGYAR